jgi:DnaK suppressor protein
METRKSGRNRRKAKATTADIVGQKPRQVRIRAQWRPYYDRLLDLLDHWQQHRADLAKDALEEQPSFATHMADAGTDTYDRDLALGMLSFEQDALYEIEAALNRIRNGVYGICELTGKPIERARLAAIPWTRFSAAAEKQVERDGALRRAKLGPRQTVTRVEASAEPEEPS